MSSETSIPAKKLIAFRRMEANRDKRAPKLNRFWFSLVIQKFPQAVPPVWRAKEKSMAKQLTARIGSDQIFEFAKWSIDNWSAIIRMKFGWMRKAAPPETPSFPFFVRFVHVFKEAKEADRDHPLQLSEIVRGLNLGKTSDRCETNLARSRTQVSTR